MVCVCLSVLSFFVIGEARNHKTIQSFHPSLFCFAYLHDDDDDKHRYFFCYFSRYSTEIQAFVLNSNEIYIFFAIFISFAVTHVVHISCFVFDFAAYLWFAWRIYSSLCLGFSCVCVIFLYIIPPLFLTYLPALVCVYG